MTMFPLHHGYEPPRPESHVVGFLRSSARHFFEEKHAGPQLITQCNTVTLEEKTDRRWVSPKLTSSDQQ